GAAHIDRTIEIRALRDSDSRRGDIPANFRRRHDENGDGGHQIALYSPFDNDAARVRVTYHDTIDAHREALSVVNGSLHSALQDEIFIGRQLALENQGLPENGRLRGLTGGPRGALGRRKWLQRAAPLRRKERSIVRRIT